MKDKFIYIKKTVIFLLCILFIYIIFQNIFFKKVEGFNVKEIDKTLGDIKNITREVGKIPNEIKNVEKKLTSKVDKLGKEIEKKTIDTLTKKLKSIFKQLGNIFDKGLIKPITSVFTGIGGIFTSIFGILTQIANKIVSLPGCIFTYAIKEPLDALNNIYRRIMPNFIKNILGSIYKYTFRYLFDFIGYITGYTASVNKCYGFNISSEVSGINKSLNKIEASFKKDFGRLDFTKIKV